MTTLQAIKYTRGSLEILNQLLLPHTSVYDTIHTCEDSWRAIREMKVRGAPAIAIVAALSLAVELHERMNQFQSVEEVASFIKKQMSYLSTSRPTAVNLFRAKTELNDLVDALVLKAKTEHDLDRNGKEGVAFVREAVVTHIENMLGKDVADNKKIGSFGAEFILERKGLLSSLQQKEGGTVSVITHCNTGSLATAGYGTALGVIRSLHHLGKIERVYCTETRPYNQGARLTAYELVYEKIPSTLITDSMVSALLATNKISAIVVGADRIAANGDTANKIGTYQLAVSAKYHGVLFIVAAPTTSIDVSVKNGSSIEIEQRSAEELTHVNGIKVAADGIDVWNPGFDVTPASLIDAIVTEAGVIIKSSNPEVGFPIAEFCKAALAALTGH